MSCFVSFSWVVRCRIDVDASCFSFLKAHKNPNAKMSTHPDLNAYYIDEPTKKVSVPELDALGVLSWKLDADNYEAEGKLDQICKERGYTYKDFVNYFVANVR